jgi:hypothetical protein
VERLFTSRWKKMEVVSERIPQRLRWMVKHRLTEDMFVTETRFSNRCLKSSTAQSELVLREGEEVLARTRVSP